MENIKGMKKEIENTARDMIKDYLYYGYGLKTWQEQDYEITNYLGLERIKELFKEEQYKMGKEF